MIGIIGNARKDGKSSFDTLIKYCAKDGRAAYIGMQNIHFPESAAEEMESLAFENPRCKDPLMHIILSWREMELPTNGQIDEAVKIALKELDLQNCQAVWIVHADTENRHVHIAANRIDPETHRAIRSAGGWTHKAIQRAAPKDRDCPGLEPGDARSLCRHRKRRTERTNGPGDRKPQAIQNSAGHRGPRR